ncbi:MAG: hypothetical protein A2538_03990 [Candidatus Magasanikbacteria bacterium RIFOXYD2_FULL_41_14]|uniref:DUF3828 domain-containing protein n=1 Tax=Candidatus Magasanikbacteria bacterium RIFOXYD2_FULL_41_14 TaxID=1798709 RepID=A0A1F6PFY4_9BACT|nr:MAG: hypothetical protein A2538_03990 [Candidatus Magasanikbacteria bacterium RIFOXYD2_FULL_41_14]
MLSKKKAVPDANLTNNNTAPLADVVLPTGQTVVVNPITQGVTAQVPTALETEQNSVRQLARIFIERYNSYSSAGNFENLLDVKDFSTPALWVKISGPLTSPRPPSGSFVGVSTLAVSSDLSDWQGSSAQVDIKTHITEDKENKVTSRLAGVSVYLVKTNGNWLVDKFIWEK